ncbi:hypothetical protein LRD18_07830 [Halorhodospira halochloris]|uniref:hypothetical protein n=1 Tax=Halorhodospira halochloris TaxID=1052 RepID=UPI001EE96D16|nr:hypothetical protein [Halorhodospira halochloris]MCG5530784.1 hypothetical protein [Halorhodospira halochloris]
MASDHSKAQACAPESPRQETHPVWELLSCVRIAHHISGRIRFKLEADLAARGLRLPSKDSLKKAHTLLQQTPGIKSVRINPYAHSCTIEYDPQRIPEAGWSDLLAGKATPQAAELQQLIDKTLQESAVQAVIDEAMPNR